MASITEQRFVQPVNARHGYYVRVVGTQAEQESGAFDAAAQAAAQAAGWALRDTSKGPRVYQQAGVYSQAFWYYAKA